MFPVQDKFTKLMSSFKNLNLNCEHQAEIVSFHALTRTPWEMEILANVACMEKRTWTLLYFREFPIPVILKSKGVLQSLKRVEKTLKKSREIDFIISHLLDAYHNHLTQQRKIEIHPSSGKMETFCNVRRQQIQKSAMFWSVQLLLTHVTWKKSHMENIYQEGRQFNMVLSYLPLLL